ncbi:MFS transporter [Bacillus cereus group sp. BfR-BA-01425]|uniref:MFS transporter n=1 Tax=Bacillus cereus group sp. BfR-BA-01425 TaxID=2920342 RepID=UPI001F583D89|nr:MFS transporter [Bacillus cereus group sp. BfR-BA-01425]
MDNTNVVINRKLSLFSEKLVILIAGIGMFLSTLDTGIINIALPYLEKEFHSTVTITAWSVTIYVMALSATILLFGKISDRVGRFRICLYGFFIFLISSILCGLAQEMWQLIVFRAIQGVGAAALQATSAALITTLVSPENRNHALGTLGVMIGLGPILGPTAGGLFISLGSWRWIFWINIPLCLIGLWACYKISRFIKEEKHPAPIDVLGNIYFTLSALLFLFSLSHGANKVMGSIPTWGYIIASIILLVIFIFHESNTKHPIIDVHLFLKSTFIVPILATIGFGVASAIIFIVPPYFLQNFTSLTPLQTGFVLLSAPLGLVIFSRIAGKFMGRFGTTLFMRIGLGIMFIAFVGLSFIEAQWSPYLLASVLFLYGIGGGIFQPANIASIMASVSKEKQGSVGAVQRMLQNVAIAFGAAVAATFMSTQSYLGTDGLIQAFRYSWYIAGGLLLFNILCFLGYRKS